MNNINRWLKAAGQAGLLALMAFSLSSHSLAAQPPTPVREVLFVDSSVAEAEAAGAAARPGVEVISLDPSQDELSQMTRALVARQGVAAVHILSHGAPGVLRLGDRKVNQAVLEARAAELAGWRSALTSDAEILVYGCNVAEGAAGEAFLTRLAGLTGAGVAGSSNPTGAGRRGGDWQLEWSSRPMHMPLAVTPAKLEATGILLVDYLFFHDGTAGKLIRTELDGTSPTEILTYNGSVNTTALDLVRVDPVHSVLYYNRVFNDVNRGLYKTDYSGTSPVRISPNSTNIVSGVCLDLVNSKLYLHDDTAGLWYRCNLDGTGMQTLMAMSGSGAFAEVDPANNMLYYTSPLNNASRGLYRTDLAMSTAGTRISTSNNQITGLALDTVNSKIYFHDNTAGNIVQASPDGSNPNSMLAVSGFPAHLAVDPVNNRVYFYRAFNDANRGLHRTASLNDFSSAVRISSGANAIGPVGMTVYAGVAPTVTGVTATNANGGYNAGKVISIQVSFSQAVIVTGTPRLTLETGTTDAVVNYASGSGSSNLVFNYTVQAGETSGDLDYQSTGALTLNGGTIKNAANVAANPTLPSPGATGSLAANKALVIDTTSPSVSIGSPSVSITGGGPVSFTVTYSDANFNSSTLSAGKITLNSTGTASANSVIVSGSGTTRTVTVTGVTGNGTLGISVASGTATDTAGNTASSAGPSTTFTVDNNAPTVSIGSPSVSITGGGPVSFTVTYSDASFNSATLSAGNVTVNSTGTASASSVVVSGSGTTRTVTLSGLTGNGTLGISLPSGTATDTAGNTASSAGPSTTFTVDNTAPVVTSVSVPADGAYRAGQNLNFTVNFNEAVNVNTGSGIPRLPITLATGGTVYASYLSGSNSTSLVFRYTVQSGQNDADGITVGGSLEANGGTLRDAAGNDVMLALNSVGSTTGVLVDTTAPTINSITRKTPAGQTVSITQVVFAVTFSEPVTGLTANNFSVTPVNSSITGTVDGVSGGPQVYDVAVSITGGVGEFRLDAFQEPD